MTAKQIVFCTSIIFSYVPLPRVHYCEIQYTYHQITIHRQYVEVKIKLSKIDYYIKMDSLLLMRICRKKMVNILLFIIVDRN